MAQPLITQLVEDCQAELQAVLTKYGFSFSETPALVVGTPTEAPVKPTKKTGGNGSGGKPKKKRVKYQHGKKTWSGAGKGVVGWLKADMDKGHDPTQYLVREGDDNSDSVKKYWAKHQRAAKKK